LTSQEQNTNIGHLQADVPVRSWNKATPTGFGAPTRKTVMIAPLATVVFLATLWFVGALFVETVGQSGGKILAALKGQSLLATAPIVQPISWKVSPRARSARPMRARPTLRAAA
jgi:hypothetical protein